MSILAEVRKRNATEIAGTSDNFARVWGMVDSAIEAEQNESANVKASAAALTIERDKLIGANQQLTTSNRELTEQGPPLVAEVSRLTELNGQLEESLTQARAQISLEQGAIAGRLEEHNEASQAAAATIDALKAELQTLRETNASLTGQLNGIQTSKPATIVSPPPISIAPSDLEFEIGNIVRGPDGIQGLRLKQVRTN